MLEHNGHVVKNQGVGRWLSEFKVPSPPGYIDFAIGAGCGQWDMGCMKWTTPNATVRLVPGEGVDPNTFAHELGHTFDYYVLSTVGLRPAFIAIFDRTVWKTPGPEEAFADSYALCAYKRTLRHAENVGFGWKDTPARHPQICALIRHAYAIWLQTPADQIRGQVDPLAATT